MASSSVCFSPSSSSSPSSGRSRSAAQERLVADLISLMEAGTNPWRRQWDPRGGGHQANLFSGRRYRGANPALLLLGMQLRGSVLPWWCGFGEARARGLMPRRGSRGVPILRPLRIAPAAEAAHEAAGASNGKGPGPGTGNGREEPAPAARVLYRPVVVFNAIDLQGEGLEALLASRRRTGRQGARPEPERLEAAEAVLARWSVPVVHGGDHAAYLPHADQITMPLRQDFHTASAYAATLAHECIHSTGHPSRLARDLSGSFGSDPYAREELVAELGAVLIGERLAIGSDTANHAAYLAHWVQLLRSQPALLYDVLAEASRAADLIVPDPGSGPELPPPAPTLPIDQ
jgi:antirestriction protein ArdC